MLPHFGFKILEIEAMILKDTTVAIESFCNTNCMSESPAKSSPEHRAFIAGKCYILFCTKDKCKFL